MSYIFITYKCHLSEGFELLVHVSSALCQVPWWGAGLSAFICVRSRTFLQLGHFRNFRKITISEEIAEGFRLTFLYGVGAYTL